MFYIPNLIPALADNAHKSWSKWMKYLFEKSKLNSDGSVTIPADLVKRWKRQMDTSYENLPPAERKSDVKEADEIVNIIFRATKEMKCDHDKIKAIRAAISLVNDSLEDHNYPAEPVLLAFFKDVSRIVESEKER